jgi:hypothetical protein
MPQTINREVTVGKFRFELELHWLRATGPASKGFEDKPFPLDYYAVNPEPTELRSDLAKDEAELNFLMEILEERSDIHIACPAIYSGRFVRPEWHLVNLVVYTYQGNLRTNAWIASIGRKKSSMVVKGRMLSTYTMVEPIFGYMPGKR